MAKLSGFGGIARALSERNFRIFTIGSSLSLVGMWTQRIALGWLTWELTGSGVWLGLIAFADLFPTVVLTPIAGAIADRVDRQKMIILTQALAMLQSVALTALTLLGWIEIWGLFVLTLFLGVVMSFNVAARLALMASMSSRENLGSAIALSASVFNLARFLGPAVGGFIIVGWGVGMAFAFNSLSFLSMLIALLLLRDLRHDERAGRKGGLFGQVAEGLTYAARHPGIGPMLLVISMIALFVKPFLELLPGIADLVFARGAEALAQLTAATGLGALISAIWLAQRGGVRHLTRIAMICLVIAGLAVALLAATPIYPLGLACAFVAGGALTVAGTGTQTLMQNAVDGAMRGRVMSLYGVIFRGAPALGSLALGAASEVFGLPAVFMGGGAVVILAWAFVWRRRKTAAAALERESAAKPAEAAA